MDIFKKINRIEALSINFSSINGNNFKDRYLIFEEIKKEQQQLERYFWFWFPNEIGFDELKQINPELFLELKSIKQFLGIKC